MHIEPVKEHHWLQQLTGEWTYENEAVMDPGKPPVKFQGTERARSLGGVWVLCESCGEMPGGAIGTMLMTLGFDPAKQRFVGTFIGSMMTYMWLYDGELSPDGKTLTLNADGPSFTDQKKMAKYKDVIEIQDPNHRTLTASFQADDGTWYQFMTAHYRRMQ